MNTKSRTALIGPYTQGTISAYHKVCNLGPYMGSLPFLDAGGIFLGTMFQTGVDLFEVYGFDNSIRAESGFWLKRIQTFEKDEYNLISGHIRNLFKPHLPGDYYHNDEYSPVWTWENFLTDLLYCLKRNTVMACAEIPGVDEIKEIFPPEIYIPIGNLCEQIIIEPLSVPIPKASIPRSQIKRFRAIVESDAFAQYIDAHAELDSSRRSLRNTITHVADSSMTLQYNYPALLKIRDIAMGLVPASGKLISTVFQQIPGEFTSALTAHISSWISSDRQVVIYETNPFMMQIVMNRILEAHKKFKDEEPDKANSTDVKSRTAD